MSAEVLVVYVTAPRAEAAAIARGLVERQLAACVNIVDAVRSVYRWEGAVQEDPEALLIIKTRKEAFATLRDAVTELHSYDCPEVIALPVVDGAPAYLKWVLDSVEAP